MTSLLLALKNKKDTQLDQQARSKAPIVDDESNKKKYMEIYYLNPKLTARLIFYIIFTLALHKFFNTLINHRINKIPNQNTL